MWEPHSLQMATISRPKPGEVTSTEEAFEPPYHLVLLDDDSHTYHYVVTMLGAIFGYSVEKAFAIACVVDSEGRAILMTGSKDKVTLKQEQVHAFGPDPLMAVSVGSMSAVVEPAE